MPALQYPCILKIRNIALFACAEGENGIRVLLCCANIVTQANGFVNKKLFFCVKNVSKGNAVFLVFAKHRACVM